MKPQANIGESYVSIPKNRFADWATLIKIRISAFVVMSTMVGFVLGSESELNLTLMFHALLATFLTVGGTSALNQYLERDLDARMRRTADRPLPAGRLQAEQAFLLGLLMTAVGVLYLGMWVNWLTSLLAILTSIIYLCIYTPLKKKTTWNTMIGAVPGALPPVGGWAAARGEIGLEACILFVILFLWQFPHFYSIAWIYREEYSRAGFKMLSDKDAQGNRTARHVVFNSLILLPFSLLPALLGFTGPVYFYIAALMSLILLVFSISFARYRTNIRARRLLQATLIYLPTIWMVLVLDRIVS